LLIAITKVNEIREKKIKSQRTDSLLDIYVWFYTGCILVIVGSIATVIGPGVKDPIIRIINTEIPAVRYFYDIFNL